jgi:hypothetical protein
MRESYSLSQLANNNDIVIDKSSGGQNFSTLFKNTREKLND